VSPPSHRQSILRLIPKAGKDKTHIKNWRPITLSNCDHKLITRLYNNRLLRVLNQHISSTQTAYIKGRNIADNLRLINSVNKLAGYREGVDGTLIALDAQKAFDSVSHDYIALLLNRVGLGNFVPLFRLLYKDLRNDIMINGQIGGSYGIGNGVKQGDALSCSLFLLAIETVIPNIQANQQIEPVIDDRLQYQWPKVLAYADDITVITCNTPSCIQAIFSEYEQLTKASGLKLNADKTEKFNVTSANIGHQLGATDIRYCDKHHQIVPVDFIKINGITFHRSHQRMADANYLTMRAKMERHFREWSLRSLSLLGKIQIIKTFGLSQLLYALAVVDLRPDHWAEIKKLVYKFIWNKNFNAPTAPKIIKQDIICKKLCNGGFGMVELKEVVNALRLKRFAFLLMTDLHPIADLQRKLQATRHLQCKVSLAIDDVTSSSVETLYTMHKAAYNSIAEIEATGDLVLHRKLLHSNIKDLIRPNLYHGIEANRLHKMGLLDQKFHQIRGQAEAVRLIYQICLPEVAAHLRLLVTLYTHQQPPDEDPRPYIYNSTRKAWQLAEVLSSKNIRELAKPETCITSPKLFNISVDAAVSLYTKINKIRNVPNKTKLLRLVHGDVYCGTLMKRWNMVESDTCHRCFQPETIEHLLLHCPYSAAVWDMMNMPHNRPAEILHGELTIPELEVRADIISSLVFRKRTLDPRVLVHTTLTKFNMGLSRTKGLQQYAAGLMARSNALLA
jgi:Reverse transcriptase (RNA-dependent DNA polymerase)/zinc-binding in reverse transcriptase